MPDTSERTNLNMSRRSMLKGTLIGAASMPLAGPAAAATSEAHPDVEAGETASVSMIINGQNYKLDVDARASLLDALRDTAGLTGVKKGCDHGQCGACTVLVDGKRQLSCLSFAVMTDGKQVTTIEGLEKDGHLHPMQQAFVDHDAFQCGYCTPGQILSAVACVNEGHANSEDDIREYMSGNLCRCAAYPNIVQAIKQARDEMGRA